MAVYQTPESKKEEYRRYLEKSGVVDSLTKVLVGLYEEQDRPSNAIDFVRKYMGVADGAADVEAIREENETLKKEAEELRRTVEQLNRRLEVYEKKSEDDEQSAERKKDAGFV
uniref:c-Myc-binding protein n=1 Tax=Corethron hystrix TaxID=216773 RepID=A0A7S1FUJ8_9STRA|mmetsp:Transcript_29108/g.66711  ORF Transcript_29108/g.66711 Transcript_29108/m.66711 type:complete len:113 (+) Transcript_29108:298-636(+)|eukprot:CAMPEP_0113299150 /NCGR_PEP_ID=MMETSP0010_2-20120614/1301_1 /TAXON_ID=216773 ORGANISM="Corethron hystrix, Strain 308" /NCGR_SAMPLE_ID=MMETSP0010_2 /ASSEMBLY_ACC=CAM_ASM_000155 /LENGTH=112 /DNA_ID=CAMNT_0000152329 /DNA_START=266 /DNA_END=604 /DNA_ORIENTATION=- /assembly_acc=CAM_ASM_000155